MFTNKIRTLACMSVMTVLLTTSIQTMSITPADAAVNRIAGNDRFETSVQVSKAGFDASTQTVFIATGTNFPDALSAGAAAIKEKAPILLTRPETLTPSVETEIRRLNPNKIVIVGGTQAISTTVENRLKTITPTVQRVGGNDRFGTSRNIATTFFNFNTVNQALIATGTNFPDALSASAAAGSRGVPLLLVNPANRTWDETEKSFFKQNTITNVAIIGGESAVPGREWAGSAGNVTFTRLAGQDRFETSQRIAEAYFHRTSTAFVANGYNYPDALTGSALAIKQSGALLISRTECVPKPVEHFLGGNSGTRIQNRTMIGGTTVLHTATTLCGEGEKELSDTQMQQLFVAEVNKHRAELNKKYPNGLQAEPAQISEDLNFVAQWKARDLFNTGEFAHITSTCGAASDQTCRALIEEELGRKIRYTTYMDNIAMIGSAPQSNNSWKTAVETWKASEGHWLWMMHSEHDRVGVARVGQFWVYIMSSAEDYTG